MVGSGENAGIVLNMPNSTSVMNFGEEKRCLLGGSRTLSDAVGGTMYETKAKKGCPV